ncbi:mucin-2 protein [Nocardioides sp. GY 10113]|uniref:SH3 domain-containing protein n=1 Tax=Nocardioides sp. GY 10113 TaxID=2569761 RepID=UPI0010A8A5B9|nr:SH3 domain-containing protein [Nocardioides sp. GY 10113]TIC84826.1 mucin-2 protein [Nocardioides sp. GY 10113]
MASSHKRETARRKPRAAFIAGPLAALATGTAVSIGVLGAGSGGTIVAVDQNRAPAADLADALAASEQERGTADTEETDQAKAEASTGRRVSLSRSDSRPALRPLSAVEKLLTTQAVAAAVAAADQPMWTTEDLNLWTRPDDAATRTGVVDAGTKVTVTGRSYGEREEIVYDDEVRWVTAGYLAAEKPVAEVAAAAGLSTAPCPDGSVESGLTSSAVAVYRAVCNAFPQITSYGGLDPHGEHTTGRAIDVMTSDVELGTAIAEFLRAHASELNLYDIIWRQRIWTQERSGEGWRAMSDRGSATANHYDHVHVATY